MKKFIILLALCAGLVVSCYDDSGILDRLDALEKNAIASINEQITAIKASMTMLEDVDVELKSTIQKLEAEDKSFQEEIDKLRLADETLGAKIGELKNYIDEHVGNIEDWATVTFATLEQYDSLCIIMVDIETSISDLEKEFTQALSDAISDSETSMKTWVNEQLTGYWDIAETKARLDTLDQLHNADIEKISADLDSVKAELTESYTLAISEAIEELDGKLSEEITKINENLTMRIDDIETRLSSIEETLKNLTRDFKIEFDDFDIGILTGSSTTISYVVIGATDKTIVKALGQNGWRAKVTPEGTDKGKIKVTAPNPLTDDEIIVLVYDGEYRTIMSTINFVTGVMTPSQTAYEFSADAGTVDVPLATNINYKVSIPESAKDWLSVVETKAMRNDTITFKYTANTGYMRNCSVDFIDENGLVANSVSFVQKKVIVQTDAVDLSANGTANCYIISEEGWYKFKANVKGNSEESVGQAASVSVLWESFGTDVKPEVGDLIPQILISNGYIFIRTPDVLKEGNAVVAVKDANGTILWSWHLWITDQPVEQVYPNDAGIMMDRNLGAISAEPGEVGSFGLLYQWGRKDPFLGSSNVKGLKTLSTLVWPEVLISDVVTGTIDYVNQNPTVFIMYNKNNYDWLYSEEETRDYSTRWTDSKFDKSVLDPCPFGWRVPDGGSYGVWENAKFSDVKFDNERKGVFFNLVSSEKTWYPTSGCLSPSSGELGSFGIIGYYWSSTIGGPYNNPCNLYISCVADSDYVRVTSGSNDPALALPVRCIKE